MNTQKVILFCAFFLIASYALSNYLVIQPEEPQTSTRAQTDSENQGIQVEDSFFKGFEFQLSGTRVRSYSTYYTTDSETLYYALEFETSVVNYNDLVIEEISVQLPSGEVVFLELEEDNYWSGWYDVDEPVYDDFIFTLSAQTGESVQKTVSSDDWVQTPYDYVTPVTDEIISDSSQLHFTWDTSLTEAENFGIEIWNNDSFNYWIKVWSNSWQYNGPELDLGVYEYRLVTWIGNGEIHAISRFNVGISPTIFNTQIGSHHWYYLDSSVEDEYTIVIRTNVYVENYDEINYVKLVLPDGIEHFMEKNWENDDPEDDVGEYWIDFDITEVIYDDLEIVVNYQDEDSRYLVEAPNMFETPFRYVSPSSGSIFLSSEELIFTWDSIADNIEVFGVSIENDDFEWEKETNDYFLEYDGQPLDDGVYEFNVWGLDTNGGKLYAVGTLIIGP